MLVEKRAVLMVYLHLGFLLCWLIPAADQFPAGNEKYFWDPPRAPFWGDGARSTWAEPAPAAVAGGALDMLVLLSPPHNKHPRS
jgi:hypothetical protein